MYPKKFGRLMYPKKFFFGKMFNVPLTFSYGCSKIVPSDREKKLRPIKLKRRMKNERKET